MPFISSSRLKKLLKKKEAEEELAKLDKKRRGIHNLNKVMKNDENVPTICTIQNNKQTLGEYGNHSLFLHDLPGAGMSVIENWSSKSPYVSEDAIPGIRVIINGRVMGKGEFLEYLDTHREEFTKAYNKALEEQAMKLRAQGYHVEITSRSLPNDGQENRAVRGESDEKFKTANLSKEDKEKIEKVKQTLNKAFRKESDPISLFTVEKGGKQYQVTAALMEVTPYVYDTGKGAYVEREFIYDDNVEFRINGYRCDELTNELILTLGADDFIAKAEENLRVAEDEEISGFQRQAADSPLITGKEQQPLPNDGLEPRTNGIENDYTLSGMDEKTKEAWEKIETPLYQFFSRHKGQAGEVTINGTTFRVCFMEPAPYERDSSNSLVKNTKKATIQFREVEADGTVANNAALFRKTVLESPDPAKIVEDIISASRLVSESERDEIHEKAAAMPLFTGHDGEQDPAAADPAEKFSDKVLDTLERLAASPGFPDDRIYQTIPDGNEDFIQFLESALNGKGPDAAFRFTMKDLTGCESCDGKECEYEFYRFKGSLQVRAKDKDGNVNTDDFFNHLSNHKDRLKEMISSGAFQALEGEDLTAFKKEKWMNAYTALVAELREGQEGANHVEPNGLIPSDGDQTEKYMAQAKQSADPIKKDLLEALEKVLRHSTDGGNLELVEMHVFDYPDQQDQQGQKWHITSYFDSESEFQIRVGKYDKNGEYNMENAKESLENVSKLLLMKGQYDSNNNEFINAARAAGTVKAETSGNGKAFETAFCTFADAALRTSGKERGHGHDGHER